MAKTKEKKRIPVYIDGEIDGEDLVLLLIDKKAYIEEDLEVVLHEIRIENVLQEETDETEVEEV